MLSYLSQSTLSPEIREAVIDETAAALAARLPNLAVQGVRSEENRNKARETARILILEALQRRDLPTGAADDLVRQVMAQAFGLGWLEPLLDMASQGKITEILMNPDGSLWTIPTGAVFPEEVPGLEISPQSARVVVDKLLAPVGRRLTEAEPIVSAKLPRTIRFPAGARIHVVSPPIANGEYPAVNIRFFEAKPVTRGQMVDQWQMLPPAMADMLQQAVDGRLRMVIAGGTGTGKTTFLSYLGNMIPQENRILLVEDPSEIFLDRPNVVSLEARPPSAEGKYGVTAGNLVTAAMRMTPRWWLIVGEVRTGDVGMWLFRAQMSDHPGLSTVHATTPDEVVATFGTLLMLDMNVRLAATKDLFRRAVDLVIQIGFDAFGVRRVLNISEVLPQLKGGNVHFRPLWRYLPESSGAVNPQWEKVNEISRVRR